MTKYLAVFSYGTTWWLIIDWLVLDTLVPSRMSSRNINMRTYKTTILPVVLYGYETWSLTLVEEHRLTVFENRVLRRRFGWERDELIGSWRNILSEDLHDLYPSSSIIRMVKSLGLDGQGM
jgi:hypothetical protein